MKKRNAGIELYRCLLMLGICMIHAAGFYTKEWHWLSSAFCWCVDGFVLISGYFGCPFKPSKVLRLYACAIACSLLACQIPMVLESGYPSSALGFLSAVRDHLWYDWFPPAYVGMLLLAPVVDAALEKIDDRRLLPVFLPMLLLVFGWSFVRTYNATHPFVPEVSVGSALLLTAIYAVGRICRRLEAYGWLTSRRAWIGLLVCFPLGLLKLLPFSSPFALVTAICALRLCKDVSLSPRAERVVLLIAPSMFPVLCYQATPYVYAHVPDMVNAMHGSGIPVVAALVLTAALLYFGGILLDVPRRIAAALSRRWCRRICDWSDGLWFRAVGAEGGRGA